MTRNKIVLIVILVLFLIIIGVVTYLLLSNKDEEKVTTSSPYFSDTVQFSDNPNRGDPGYKEQNKTVVIGTEGTYKGNFDKVADGKIYFNDKGFTSEIPLNKDEVAVQCTTQSLIDTVDVDLTKIVRIKGLSPDALGTSIPQGEPIVVFVSTVGTGVQAHTILMDSSKCPE